MLSGGQRQAIAVLRTVAFAQRLVILDEPTAALGLREIGQGPRARRPAPEQGIAVILISHNLEHVAQVADRAVASPRADGRDGGPTSENHEALVSMIVGAVPPPPTRRTG